MTPDQILARARSVRDRGICYGLGKGGLHPLDPLPCRLSAKLVNGLNVNALWCDCSGFIAWVIGRDRRPSGVFDLWLSTDSIFADAKGKRTLFSPTPHAVPGCIAVYADWRDSDGQHHEGHVAIVSDPAKHLVIDCSVSGKGVTEHAQPVFWSGSHPVIFCLYTGGAASGTVGNQVPTVAAAGATEATEC